MLADEVFPHFDNLTLDFVIDIIASTDKMKLLLIPRTATTALAVLAMCAALAGLRCTIATCVIIYSTGKNVIVATAIIAAVIDDTVNLLLCQISPSLLMIG